MMPPKVRKILPPSDVRDPPDDRVLSCAYHITDAFQESDLKKIQELRLRIPLDLSRPTCPRRFLSEKEDPGDHHKEDGWVGDLINRSVASWNLDHSFVCLPWYRFLEYKNGGSMDKHTDGSNVHPITKARSVATMLLYLSSCRSGGETTLYVKPLKEEKKKKQQTKSLVLESISPVYNTVLIFPHEWPHSGDLVRDDPKIALRVDLTWDYLP